MNAFRSWLSTVWARVREVPHDVAEIASGGAGYLALLIRSRNLHIGVFLIAAFWVAAYFTRFWDLFFAVNLIIMAVEVLIMFAYLPAFMLALVNNPAAERDQIIMGIYLAWGFDLMNRVWSLFWRFNGEPYWMLQTDFLTFLLFGRLIGGVLHVTAPATVAGKVGAGSWIRIGLAMLIGVAAGIGLTIVGFGADINPF